MQACRKEGRKEDGWMGGWMPGTTGCRTQDVAARARSSRVLVCDG